MMVVTSNAEAPALQRSTEAVQRLAISPPKKGNVAATVFPVDANRKCRIFDKGHAAWLVEPSAGNVQVAIATGFDSLKCIEGEIACCDCIGDLRCARLNSAPVRCNYHRGAPTIPGADTEISALFLALSQFRKIAVRVSHWDCSLTLRISWSQVFFLGSFGQAKKSVFYGRQNGVTMISRVLLGIVTGSAQTA